ncbi:MAG: MgtC/SapB family protein [bacterium]|nr:MgtC/SapB family protein [bacterium]
MIFTSIELFPFFQLLIAACFGMILGIERVLAGRTAGPRTYGLVSLGACLLTILSLSASELYRYESKADPVSIVAAIVTGIGFLGAGLIIFKGSKLSGLTTAAGIWVSAAIGIAVGFGFLVLALFTTMMTLFIFTVMWKLEAKIKSKFGHKTPHHHKK